MKRKIKLLSIALAIAIVITSQASCDINKKEDITLIVKVSALPMNSVSNPDIFDAKDFLTEAGKAFSKEYKDANVTIDVKSFDYVDEIEAITGSFDTEYATDILFETYFNMAAYVHTGRVVPLDDIITDDIFHDISSTYWDISSIKDKTYMMPFVSVQNIIIYNKNLMRMCGLDEYVKDDRSIQNWSVDTWTNILDTLAERLPENVYPMMMYGKNNQGDTHIMSLIRAFGSTIFDENGNFNFSDEKSVKALSWIQSGVEKGWFPLHCENLEITDNQELFENNQLVFYVFNNANIPLYDSLDNYGFVNFPNNVATSFMTGFEVFDNGSDSKIAASKAFVKYIYENDEWLDISAGNLPVSQKVVDKYADKITMLSNFSANSVNVVDFMNNSPNWQGSDTSVRSVFYPNIRKLLLGTYTPSQCAAALDEDCNKALEIGRKEYKLHK
jgi:multiple sugar transport system substrate-binding protein